MHMWLKITSLPSSGVNIVQYITHGYLLFIHNMFNDIFCGFYKEVLPICGSLYRRNEVLPICGSLYGRTEVLPICGSLFRIKNLPIHNTCIIFECYV